MREFFKPWRRKIGVVTLVLACVFAAGWVRSVANKDGVEVAYADSHSILTLFSVDQMIGVQHARHQKSQKRLSAVTWGFGLPVDLGTFYADTRIRWRVRQWGAIVGDYPDVEPRGEWCRFWYIPYWSVVLPLTLLSAYLLLSKPRPAKIPAPGA